MSLVTLRSEGLMPSSGVLKPGGLGDVPYLLGRRDEIDGLMTLAEGARAGRSGALVVRGESGIGKSALLGELARRAEGFAVAHLVGVQSEMELPFAAVQQLCRPFREAMADLPAQLRDSLDAAFGLGASPPRDRYVVGLAMLQLLAAAADDKPVLCVVDDAQWLDRVSVQSIAFVARRLLAERVLVVVAVSDSVDPGDWAGLPELRLQGLNDADAAHLLDTVVRGPMDLRVRTRIVAESRGNPLALLELPGTWTTAELVDVGASSQSLPDLASGFVQRLRSLPDDTRRLLTLAAAEPLGDPTLLWRAAEHLGLSPDAASAAEAAGLIEFGATVCFRYPLVRAAAYRVASSRERLDVHGALAAVTDPALDPDRLVWHRANSTVAQDDEIAEALVQAAARAKSRGGLLAAAALLERSALLTNDPGVRADRMLSAAMVKRDAGELDAALRLLAAVEAEPVSPVRSASAERLRGQIAFDQRSCDDAARRLLDAARQFEPLDAEEARDTYLEALAAAIWGARSADDPMMAETARSVRLGPAAPAEPRPVDLVLDALAVRLTDGSAAATPMLADALSSIGAIDVMGGDGGRVVWMAGSRAAGIMADELWDHVVGRTMAEGQVRVARELGALVQLQLALNALALRWLAEGELVAAAALIDEDNELSQLTGVPPLRSTHVVLAAFRGDEHRMSELTVDTKDSMVADGQFRLDTLVEYAFTVLYNGLGQHQRALEHARRVFQRDLLGYRTLVASELAEAASRVDDHDALLEIRDWISARACGTPTDWARGVESRVQALASAKDEADAHYRDSIERLSRTDLHVELARSRLLYGEWLRREGHRGGARDQLRQAHDAFRTMGLAGFAERARRELLATGERVRKATGLAAGSLTAQEMQIVRLVRLGLTNPEVGTRLFLSPRTVEWHLRNVFAKVGVSSRRQLRDLDDAYLVDGSTTSSA